DTINGGNGTDAIDGGNGNDELQGSRGSDTIMGGAGNDKIAGFLARFGASAGPGRSRDGDVIDAGSGNDTVTGGLNNDEIEGGSGNDLIEGGQGQDTITGGSGNDTIAVDDLPSEGGEGGESGEGSTGGPVVGVVASTTDVLEGESVTFTFDVEGDIPAEGITVSIASNSGAAGLEFDPSILFGEFPEGFAGPPIVTADNVLLTLTAPNPSIDLTLADDGVAEGTEIVNLFLEDGELYDVDPDNSTIDLFVSDIEGADGGIVFAGDGNDSVFGSNRNDLLSGDAGNDTVDAGAGDDLIMGVTGRDNLTGGRGSDVFIYGNGDGTDTITDFEVGTDLIGLVEGELVFEDLTLTQLGSSTQIRVTDSGENLAILNGVDASTLFSDSFIAVPDVSNPDEAFLL
ncbi:MAG: calcium-binding protein, partial [Cyanobacteria bacterium P01_F01_bin.33]